MPFTRSGHVKYPVNLEAFLREDALSFYLLGVFLTDGNVEKISGNKSGLYRVGLSSADIDWLTMIRDIISPGRTIWTRKNQRVCRIEMANQELARWLITWGCHERKSLTLEFPDSVPDKFLSDFVRGVFDGDGSLTLTHYNKKKNGRIYTYHKVNSYICSGSRQFIDGLKRRLNSVGFSPSVIQARSKGNEVRRSDGTHRTIREGVTWRLQLADGSAIPFLRWMYYEGNPLAMPRKAALAQEARRLFQYRSAC